MRSGKDERRLETVRELANELAGKLDLNASLRLWDGSLTPLGNNVTGPFEISIANAGVIGSLLRWPTLDNFIRHYVDKGIDFAGGTLIDLGSQLNRGGRSVKLKGRDVLGSPPSSSRSCWRAARTPPTTRASTARSSAGGARRPTTRTTSSSTTTCRNEFYALFLDPEMVYSCAYYTDWNNDVAQAQRDKLEMICRKLRLKPGERFLDIGCGWGGLICHAAKHYGVTAHGITLSENAARLRAGEDQAARARGPRDRRAEGLFRHDDGRVRQDRLASACTSTSASRTFPATCRRCSSLLSRRRAVPQPRASRGARPSRAGSSAACGPSSARSPSTSFPAASSTTSAIRIFAMERAGFEIQDVEAWRTALRAHLQAVVRAPDGQPRGGAEVRQRREVPHLGRVSRRRVAGVLARHAAHLPDAGLEDSEASAGAFRPPAPTSIASTLEEGVRRLRR